MTTEIPAGYELAEVSAAKNIVLDLLEDAELPEDTDNIEIADKIVEDLLAAGVFIPAHIIDPHTGKPAQDVEAMAAAVGADKYAALAELDRRGITVVNRVDPVDGSPDPSIGESEAVALAAEILKLQGRLDAVRVVYEARCDATVTSYTHAEEMFLANLSEAFTGESATDDEPGADG